MLYSEETVKSNIRNRAGKRVFFLGSGDTLTPSARDFLNRERIEILPAEQAKPDAYQLENGAFFHQKPEHFTHLRGNILVPKTHPVIGFRGAMDTLQAQILLAQAVCGDFRQELGEILELARNIIRWDVLQEPVVLDKLCGLTVQELRERSHYPQKYYGVAHFMPSYADGAAVLQLNLTRCTARQAELAAAHAFGERRTDLLQALNRMSSAIYILMIQAKMER